MVSIRDVKADTTDLKEILKHMDITDAYFDTSYVGRPEDVFGYKMDTPYVSADRIESGEELYRRMLLMDESRQDFSNWRIKYRQPHEPVEDHVRIDMYKEYGQPKKGDVLTQMELEDGRFKVEGYTDPDELPMEKIDSLLE